jgi:hypothetical protein
MITVFHRLYAYRGITPACLPDAFCGCCVEWEGLLRGGGGGADRRGFHQSNEIGWSAAGDGAAQINFMG